MLPGNGSGHKRETFFIKIWNNAAQPMKANTKAPVRMNSAPPNRNIPDWNGNFQLILFIAQNKREAFIPPFPKTGTSSLD